MIDRKLVYLKGIPDIESIKNTFISDEYLSSFGKIIFKNVTKGIYQVDKNRIPCLNIHILYKDEISAALAILAINKFKINDFVIKAKYGMNKYCTIFLAKKECRWKNCYFLHSFQEKKLQSSIDNQGNHKKVWNVKPQEIIVFLLKQKSLDELIEEYEDDQYSFFPNKWVSLKKIKNFVQQSYNNK